MLDKGQIKDWDGGPERDPKTAPGQPAVEALRPDVGTAFLAAREAIPTGEHVTLTAAEVAARKRRNSWIALALGLFVILVFVLTMAKVGGGVPVRM